MAYSKEKKEQLLNDLFSIIENGKSLRFALNEISLCKDTFYDWIEKDKNKSEQYARACEARADLIFEEIITISEHTEEDHTPFTGGNVIQRDRLRIDARKWILSKMNPKKYGDKIETTIQGSLSIPNLPDIGNR